MGDLALKWNDSGGSADLALSDDDLATDEGLRTACLLSLFLDRRAEDDDALPSEDGDKRGWWGDQFAETTGDLIGSRLWLLDRSKRIIDIIPQAEEYDRQSLQWMIEDRVAERIDVVITLDGPVIYHDITIYRPSVRDPSTFRFAHTWDAELSLLDSAGLVPLNTGWRAPTIPAGNNALYWASGAYDAFGNKEIFVGGDGGGSGIKSALTSPDGNTWAGANLPSGVGAYVFAELPVGNSTARKWSSSGYGNWTLDQFLSGSWSINGTFPAQAVCVHGIVGLVCVGTHNAGGSCQVYKSTNNGVTWTQIGNLGLPSGGAIYFLWVNSASDIFACDGSHVYHWNGSAWSTVLTARGVNVPNPGDQAEALGPIWGDGTHVYVGGNRNGTAHGIWYSGNNGTTWTEQHPATWEENVAAIYSDGVTVYACGESFLLLHTPLGVDGWALETGLPAGYTYAAGFPDSRYWNGIWASPTGAVCVVGIQPSGTAPAILVKGIF